MRHRDRFLPGLWLALALGPGLVAGAGAASLQGHVTVSEREKTLRSVSDLVVYYRPDEPVSPTPDPEPQVMATFRKRFQPRVLAVPVGGTVRFPNRDPILHNVFSVSGDNAFDVGLYGEGEGSEVTFTEAGLVKVYCNVHQAMIGHILVLDTPFHTLADESGRFRLDDLPEGSGKLYVWHERARRPLVLELDLPRQEPTMELELELTKRRVPSHKNKHGRSYRQDQRRY